MKIYARKTTTKQIDDKIADDFIEQHHRQGLPVHGNWRRNIGCFYGDTLVGVVTFSVPRTKAKKREYQYELVRMVFPKDVTVVGGASKMIKTFITQVKPRNFFTYQTTSGDNSRVYEFSGMTLRQKGKSKTVLVKNGHTYESAVQSKEKYLYLNHQLINLGPDALLGTNLGEKYDKDARLTNQELFIKYCDYHIETIPGDNVYEFENPIYQHYIYKLTTTNPNDKRYYIGRHSHIISTVDNYMGTGGKGVQEWKQEVLNSGYELVKVILSVHNTYRELLKAEEKAIGDLYLTDRLCMNSVPGGAWSTNIIQLGSTKQVCPVHGLVTYQGKNCCKCMADKRMHIDHCEKHGETTFSGGNCCKCVEERSKHKAYCKVCQKETTWRNTTCMSCVNRNMHKIQNCPVHGETKHRSGTCMKCASAKVTRIKKVPVVERVHCDKCNKIARHVDGKCGSCVEKSLYNEQTCPVHGLTKFRANKCCACRAAKMREERKAKRKENKK